MTWALRAEDAAWMAGGNNEQIDVNDVSRTIDVNEWPVWVSGNGAGMKDYVPDYRRRCHRLRAGHRFGTQAIH